MNGRYEREIRAAVAEEGMTVLGIEVSGHVKVRVGLGGLSRLWVMGSSPSDHRAFRNGLTQLRRLKRLMQQELEQGPAR